MLDPRIYRAAFVPVLFALVLVAFSLQDRPRPLTTTLAPDAFDGARAFGSAEGLLRLARLYPDRRPGSLGDERLADDIAGTMGAAGFRVRKVVREGETIDGERELVNVIAERAGTSDDRIVVVAHRDAAAHGALAELSSTAALLELVRVFGAPRQTRRTLTLVSTSGGSGGAAGAAALADELGGGSVSAVLVLGDMASLRVHPPLVTPWSNALGATPQRLRSTVQEAVRVETGSGAGPPRALSQFARLALPVTLGEQGALLARGLPAVLLSTDGDRPPPPDARVSRVRLKAFGRAALRTVTVLDGAPTAASIAPQATSSDLVTRRKVLPGWAIRLLAGALLLPPLIAALDALAALLRKGERVGAWLRWTLALALPFALTGLFAILLAVTGLLTAPDAPVAPQALPIELPALLAVMLVFVLGWIVLRPAVLRVAGAVGDPAEEPGAGTMLVLVALAATLAVWIANPYAALLLVPAMHLWLFALAPAVRMRRAVAVALVALGVAPAALVALALAHALGFGVAGTLWAGVLLVAGGHASAASVLLWSVLAGCGAGALIVASRAREPAGGEPLPITVRGPRTYAGPGSLGGTESALRK